MSRSAPQLRVALLLGVGGVLATALLFPYVLATKPGALAMASAALRVPAAAIVALQSLQSGMIVFLLAWIGLKLGARLELGAPWLAAWSYGRPRPAASAWPRAAVLGLLAGAAVLGAIALFGAPIAQEGAAPAAAAWKGLLASFYGAIVEETGLRAFVMGGAAWLMSRLFGGAARPWILPAAILVAALLFGAGHLPMAAQLAPLSAGVVARVVAYNALAGLAFGWLYWKHGLEHAMLAHFCADLVLHVAAPVLG